MTTIKTCYCDHEYQDKVYGKGKRVMNKKAEGKGWRCTVCGKDSE